MQKVPTNSRRKFVLELFPNDAKIYKVSIGDGPSQTAVLVDANEIDRQSELMVGLPHARFRSSEMQELLLPFWQAVCLERFVTELQATGLMRVTDCVRQSNSDPLKFWVEK